MCFHNNENTIEKSLLSLSKQTHSDFICFIIDDGSSDKSSQIVEKFISSDDRFRFFKLSHSGVGASRNFALTKVYSEGFRYLAFLDADDFYSLNKLEIQINELIKDKDVALVTSASRNYFLTEYMVKDFNFVSDYETSLFNDSFFDLMQNNFTFAPAASMVELSRIKSKPYNSQDVSGEDYKFFLDLFFENPLKKIIYADLYTCSVRENSLQRRNDANLNSAIARYNSTKPYLRIITDPEGKIKVENSSDKYLDWISYQTQLHTGYLSGVIVSIRHFSQYSNKIKFCKQLLKRLLSFNTMSF
jgi:glycosyltransferase involved in cell wall biosynthesis